MVVKNVDSGIIVSDLNPGLTLNKFINFSVPLFPYLYHRGNNSI